MRLVTHALPVLAAAGLAACNTFAPCGTSRMVMLNVELPVVAATGFASTHPDSVAPHVVAGSTDMLWDSNLERRAGAFEALWGALVEGDVLTSGQGVALTLEGRVDSRTESIARIVIVLPTPLRSGAQYQVSQVIAVPFGLRNPDVYGTRYLGVEPLASAGVAAFGLFYGRREFAPGDPLATEIQLFAATSVSGNVRVTSDRDRTLQLRLDVTVADTTGRTLHLQGDADALGQVQNNRCIS